METLPHTLDFKPLISSGLDALDDAWGGFYRSGSYLVFGRAASGRTLLALRFLQAGVEAGDEALFIAPDRPKDLIIQAASIGFDLRRAHEAGRVRLMRVAPSLNLRGAGDDGLVRALRDLALLLHEHRPARFILTDFAPFVQFQAFSRFQDAFVQLLEHVDPVDATTLLGMPEPANDQSRQVIQFMSEQLTGSLHVERPAPDSTQRRLTLLPNIGHLRRQQVTWDLAPLVEATRPDGAAGRILPAAEAASGAEPRPDAAANLRPVDDAAPADDVAPARDEGPAPPPAASERRFVHVPEMTPSPPAGAAADSDDAEPRVEMRDEADYTDRAAFQTRLAQLFERRGDGETSFLLIAMRMDRSEPRSRPFDFDFIFDLTIDALGPDDDVLADMEHERLIVLLTDRHPDEAQRFFGRLRRRLHDQAPKEAEQLLHSVSAIVVPDGRPFEAASAFVDYALDPT